MLGNQHYDQSALDQYEADAAALFQFQMEPRLPTPGPQGVGVFVDRITNGQSHVDVETLLRNQSFVDSHSTTVRQEADAKFSPYMNQTVSNVPVQNDLVTNVGYTSRACSQMSELSIDRFDFLPEPRMGFQYGFSQPQFGIDTKNAAKDQYASRRQ